MKNMKNKVLVIVLLLVIAGLALVGYKSFLSPQGVEGAKNVTIEIVVENENINEDFKFQTDHEFLMELLNEHKKELGLSAIDSDLGTMITGMMNYTADENSEYFHIYINERDATVGAGEIPLNNGDKYKFELINWAN